MAMVGEYPGARVNPEIITPLDKLKGIMKDIAPGGDVRFVIEQSQLVGILANFNKKQIYF